MEQLINFDDVNTKIITIRNQSVILDNAVAELYGVKTRDINKAVKNNLNKFPKGYIFELSKQEWRNWRTLINANNSKSDNSECPVETFHRMSTNNSKSDSSEYPVKIFDRMSTNDSKSDSLMFENLKSTVPPKAFTEKGLYMLATILKSPQATETTIAIVEAFAKLKELSNNLIALSSMEEEVIEPEELQSTGGLLKDLLFSAFPQSSAETSLEVNLGIMKLKREVKNENPNAVNNTQILQKEIDELKKMMVKMNERLEKM